MESSIKILAVVQARLASKRFPYKVLQPVNKVPMLGQLLKRLKLSKKIDKIIVATTKTKGDEKLISYIESIGFGYFAGNENDVLQRFVDASEFYKPFGIVRITADCPLVDYQIVDECIDKFFETSADYVTNTMPPTYPDGLDVEVISYKCLIHANKHCNSKLDREHVTPYIRNSKQYSKYNIRAASDLSNLRLTVDEPDDIGLIDDIFKHFQGRKYFSLGDIEKYLESNPELTKKNQHIERNSGMSMSNGQKFWQRAKRVIAGGNMLLSKNPDIFLPQKWPAYFSKTKGCFVWDIDGNKYIDMSIMGIGTNTLGYSHQDIDNVVMDVIRDGNMSTLNCFEEVILAEKLISLHPWAEMVKFARTGGEANTIAVRIARAASGKDKIAVCGYHGWHDWYLSANLTSTNSLKDHLLPGLNPLGVPKALQGNVHTFQYNDYDKLNEIVSNHEVGVIKMEVLRNKQPEHNFLQKIRKLCNEKNIVLIFDECTSGFRETLGGIHKKYDVAPDIAIFGKALGNGYAITSVIGRKSVMQYAEDTFISSTFWTERIGPTAAIKTIEVMNELRSWENITEKGNKLRYYLQQVAENNNLKIQFSGIPAITSFSIEGFNPLIVKTYVAQEMLKSGYLASNLIFLSCAHNSQIFTEYTEHMEKVFAVISKCDNDSDLLRNLEGPICLEGFKRLN